MTATDNPQANAARLGGHSSPIFSSPEMVGDAVMVLDIGIIIATCLIAHIGYEVSYLKAPADLLRLGAVGFFAAGIFAAIYRGMSGYVFDRLVDLGSQLGRLALSWTAAILGLIAIAFVLKISASYSRGWLITWFALAPFVLLVGRTIMARTIAQMIQSERISRHVAIVGIGSLSLRLFEHLKAHRDTTGIKVIGFFDDRASQRESSPSVEPFLGTIDDLVQYARNNRLDEIFIALPWSADERIAKLERALSSLPCDIRLVPDLVGIKYKNRPVSRIGGMVLMDLNQKPIRQWWLMAKVVQDYVLATLALIATAPLMGLIALAIKIDTPGPVFFTQRRRGYNENVIRVLKFRTMTVTEDCDQNMAQATKNDSRITRVGQILRQTSLDELPQLFNVLQGNMSIVGPRPHALAMDEEFARAIEEYQWRHRVKPGITGWAQVNGYRGETNTLEKLQGRIECDIYYIQNWSIWFDWKIMALTLVKGFFHKNAY